MVVRSSFAHPSLKVRLRFVYGRGERNGKNGTSETSETSATGETGGTGGTSGRNEKAVRAVRNGRVTNNNCQINNYLVHLPP